jgi:hypothetical protein
MFTVDPELYARYKDEILSLCNSFQRSDHRPLSDAEIAARLGLDQRMVTEIRVVAERDRYPIETWEEATEFKKKACREYFARRGRL